MSELIEDFKSKILEINNKEINSIPLSEEDYKILFLYSLLEEANPS